MFEQIRKTWNNSLIKVSPSAIKDWQLPDETIKLLTEVGLPVDKSLSDNPDFMMKFNPNKLETINYQGNRYLGIGAIGQCKIAIKEKQGEIIIFSFECDAYETYVFMNSSIVNLLMFITVLADYFPPAWDLANKVDAYFFNQSNLSDEDKQTWVRLQKELDILFTTMVDKLREIDAKALAKQGNYWTMDIGLVVSEPPSE